MNARVASFWKWFRARHVLVQVGGWVVVVFVGMAVFGAIVGKQHPSSDAATAATTPPVTTKATTKESSAPAPKHAKTASKPAAKQKRHAKPASEQKPVSTPARKKRQPPKRLCEYPGMGAEKLISPIPGPSSDATWNAICASNGGHPAIRYSKTLFIVPYSNVIYRVVEKMPNGGWLVKPTKP